MKRFKTRKKSSKKLIKIIFIICFMGSFSLVFSWFVNPNLITNYIRNTHFNINNLTFASWFLNTNQVQNLEENIGNMEYIPDPKPQENKQEAIVYIYNTHQTEEYFIDLLMEHDVTPSVMTASYILREKLNELNIYSMVETNDFSKILKERGKTYQDSYLISREFMEQAVINYPTLKYFIDVHRDSIAYENSTLVTSNMVYAKVLFVIGTEHANYMENKSLAENISNEMNNLIPGISRGILEKGGVNNNGIYNQDFDCNTILIEIGSSYNSINEVKNTMDVLAKSIKKVVENA